MAVPKLAIKLKSDSGSNALDAITKSGALSVPSNISGIKLFYQLVKSGEPIDQNWTAVGSKSIPSPSSDGEWTLLLQARDKKGNVISTLQKSFTLDSIAKAPEVSLTHDTGTYNDDLVSNDGSLNINAETGAKIKYSINAGKTWSSHFKPIEGLNSVLVRQTDLAGNVSTSTHFKFTLDTTGFDTAPDVSLVNDSSDGYTGHDTDLITNQPELNIETLDSNATTLYSMDGGATWLDTFNAHEGANQLLVKQVDSAGNSSPATNFEFILDQTVNEVVVSLLNDSSNGEAGYDSDTITNDAQLLVENVEAGAHLEFSLDQGMTWQTDFLPTEGINEVQVRQTDVAGNISNPTKITFTLDTQAPDTGEDSFTVDAGVSTILDILANDGNENGLEMQSIDSFSALGGSITQNDDGSFSYQPADGFSGEDSFQYSVVDAAGNVSTSIVNIVVQQADTSNPNDQTNTVFTSYQPESNTLNDLTNALLATNAGIEIDTSSIVLNASANSAVNFYDGSLSGIGIGAGLLLTSGTTPGTSNTSTGFGTDNTQTLADGTQNVNNGDSDLDAVVSTVFHTQSYDATTLSFSFNVTEPTATSISFNLVFGSDEYPEWVDAFVDSGVVMVNGENVALFNHDAMAPLSVIGSNLSAGYFQDNQNGALPIEYDGLSKVLTIVAPIQPGTNTIKIGIGDTGDHILDSGIFISNLTAGNWQGSGVLIEDNSSSAEDDNLSGSTASDLIDLSSGNDDYNAGAGDDIVDGGSGDDSVSGGSGSDTLTGGTGNDDFDYSNIEDWAANSGDIDTITDFSGNHVTLDNMQDLDNTDGDVLVFSYQTLSDLAGSLFTDQQAVGASGNFSTLTEAMMSSNTDGSADQAFAQFVYDQKTGILSFDTDGTGVAEAIEVTSLGNTPDSLSNTSIVLAF